MSKGQTLLSLVKERLALAAEDIFVLFERTIAEYEEELCRSKEETQRKQQLLDQLHRPTIQEVAEKVQIPSSSPGPGLNQEIQEIVQIKEEPEEQSVKQEEEQLPVLSSHTANDESEPPSSSSAAKTEMEEAEREHYNQVQSTDRSSNPSPQKNTSAPEITIYVEEMTGADRGAEHKKHQCSTGSSVSGQRWSCSNMADSLVYRFLKRRGVPEGALRKMHQDRVDATVIGLMDDAKLADYLPALGDRLAARHFCSQNREALSTKSFTKNPLYMKLKRNMYIEMEQNPTRKKKRLNALNNKWARKKTRKIEVGWIHKGKQVRKKKGGGTFTVDVPRESKKADLLQFAKDLFFPQGKNELGRIETMSCDIVDYQRDAVIDDDLTVGDLYDIHKMGMLRFYLSTNCLSNEEDNSEEMSEQGQEDIHMPQDMFTLSDTPRLFCGAQHEEPLTEVRLDTLVWEGTQQHDDISIILL